MPGLEPCRVGDGPISSFVCKWESGGVGWHMAIAGVAQMMR